MLATAANLAPLVAGAALSLAIARLYGPSGTGVFSLAINFFDVVLMIFTFGLSTGVTYYVSRREWSLVAVRRETDQAALLLGVAGLVCGFIFFLATRHSVLRGISPAIAAIALGGLPFAVGWALKAAVALGIDRYEAYAGLEIVFASVLLVAGVVLAVIFGITGAVIAFALANVLAAGYGATWIRREIRLRGQPGTSESLRPSLSRAFAFGSKAWTANLLQLLNYRLDLFFVSAVASRATVGVYSVAVAVTGLGWLLPNALQTVLFPRVASLHAATTSGDMSSHEADSAAARALRHSVILVVPTALLLALGLEIVPALYGARFSRSVELGLILIPGVVALGIGKVASAIVSGRGFPRYALYATVITAPVTLGLYLVLIPRFHASGAAVASTFSYLLTTGLSLMFLRRASDISLRGALIPRRSDLRDYGHAVTSVVRQARGR